MLYAESFEDVTHRQGVALDVVDHRQFVFLFHIAG
jgi:hypothetical protein